MKIKLAFTVILISFLIFFGCSDNENNIEKTELVSKDLSSSNLLFSFYEIHKHKSHREDPEKFDPERFSETDPYLHTPYYAPFGAGPRKCIGNNFAMFEMMIAIAEMVKKYRIYPRTTPIELLPLITLEPKNAVLRFESGRATGP